MAKANRFERTITTKVKTKVPGIELNLTVEEAEVLCKVFANIAGNPLRTARGITDEVCRALHEAGVVRGSHPIRGTLTFVEV